MRKFGLLNLLRRKDLFIVLRQSLDWEHITMEAFREQSRVFCQTIGRPDELVNELVDLWNDTFGVSFFEVRQEIKRITLENLKRVRNSSIITLGPLERGEVRDGVYLFVDDDDWVAPGIRDVLRAQDPSESDGFIWESVLFGGYGGESLQYRGLSWTCYTNNYAVTDLFLRDNPEQLKNVYQHWGATPVLKESRVQQVTRRLTVTNKHPCSTLFLEKGLKDEQSSSRLLELLQAYNQRLAKLDMNDLSGVRWARGEMESVREFFLRVEKSAK